LRSRVKMWGNSLALRIPKQFRVAMGIEDDAAVELILRGPELAILPMETSQEDLEDLLMEVTDQNVHQRVKLHALQTGGR